MLKVKPTTYHKEKLKTKKRRKVFLYYVPTLKPRHNESRYSEFCDIVNNTQLPFSGFTKHVIFEFDIVNYSI